MSVIFMIKSLMSISGHYGNERQKMNNQIKAALDSYLRNLLGVVLALVTTTMASAGIASPLDFGVAEWLTVANGLWAAAVPTLIRWVNKKDPAFGLVAETLAKSVTTKLETATVAAKKAPTKKTAAKKPAAKK
jgi:type IV secretory pathway TrbD component